MATLSVVVIIENCALTINKMIDSIVQQSRKADEILLFDNCSTDGSVDCIKNEIAMYSYITVYQSSVRLDRISAMSKAATLIKGDYSFITSATGWILPGYFEEAMDMASKYPDAGIVCADDCVYETKNGQVDAPGLMWAETPSYLSPDQLSTGMAGLGIVEHTVIFRRNAFFEAGGFSLELKWYSDWFVSLVTAFRFGCIYFPHAVHVDNSKIRDERLGHANTPEQLEIITILIRLLKSERYSDVLPHFVKAGAMSEFPLDAVKVVMHTPEFWDSASMLLITHPLHFWNNHLIQLRNDRQRMAIERKVYAIVKDCDTLIDNSKGDESEKKITDLIYQFPKFPDGYRLMAKLMVQKGNFVQALESCKTWISLQPQNVQAKIFEGFILFNMKEHQAAEKSFHDVLVIDPSNLDALINLAELSMHFKRGTDALGYLHRAQKCYPDNHEINTMIGSFRKELGMSV
jgi:glycosyltransferase involved in cell wall biosynthesis